MRDMRKLRPRTLIALALAALLLPGLRGGVLQATRFGRNKVQYRTFDWKIAHTEHFDVYFYEGSEDLAEAVGVIVERANADLERVLDHRLSTVIPVIVYASHNDFEQTNVVYSHVEETVGGFTELFKNRVVVPFTGSYGDLRHVLYHELTHVFMFDIVYGGLVESVVRQAYMNPVPLWFVEGLAEYVSRGTDPETEMIMRDLTISDMLVPLEYLYGGYLVYKEGQSALTFIEERYGREKIAEIVRGVARTHNLERALKDAVGLSTPELSKEWANWLRQRYWPEVRERGRAEDVARLLTDHRRDASFINLGPAISPDGGKVVFLSDRSGYADVYVASTLDGKTLGKIVSGERSDEFEALHVLRTGFTWSPDGSVVCLAVKAGASDALQFVDAESGRLLRSARFDLDGIFTPAWSPDGTRIAFVGTRHGASDLYVTDPEGETLVRLTDDFHDERDPAWSPDGTKIAFASDRGCSAGGGPMRDYDLFAVDVETRKVELLVATPGREESPAWSPDGKVLAYASERDGSVQLYFADLEAGTSARATSFVGGATSPSWSPGGERLVFACYGNAGWDIATVKAPLDAFAQEIERSGWFPSVEPKPEWETPVAPGAERPNPDEASATAAGSPDVEGVPSGEAAATDTSNSEADSEAVRRAREAFLAAGGEAPVPDEDEVEDDQERRPGTIERYKPRFTPDWITGGVSYTSGYGLSGAAQIAVSDVLGNHRFYLASDFFSSIEASNFYALYEHLGRRANFSVGIYNFKDYYYSERTWLGEDLGEKRYFTERSYGLSVGVAYPFSKFTRVEFDVSALSLDRQFAEENEQGEIVLTEEEVSRSLVIPSVRLVNDTTLWGSVGPISGGRSSIVLSRAWEPAGDFGYLTAIADVRRYLRLGARHTLALKLVAARSSAQDPQNFYMGGVNSLRGYDDLEFHGRHLALASVEFRYPFIDRLDIASPIPLTLTGLRGVMFLDAGATWDDDFRGVARRDATRLEDIKASFGVGVRLRLAFFVIRVDRAWRTDFHVTGGARTHFALGAEF